MVIVAVKHYMYTILRTVAHVKKPLAPNILPPLHFFTHLPLSSNPWTLARPKDPGGDWAEWIGMNAHV